MSLIPQPGNLIFQGDDGKKTLRVGGSGSIISGLVFDAIDVSYPTAITEVFDYYEGGLAGTILATVTVTYVTALKDDIVSVVKT